MRFLRPADLRDDPGLDEWARRIPPVLYKYSPVSGQRLEWIKSLLLDSILYFPAPSSFNDPLDCRVPPTFDASALTIAAHWKRVVRAGLVGKLSRQEERRKIKELILESRTAEGQASLAERLFQSLARNGTACLTRDPTNMLMWSYYAEGHSGVAIRFNTAPDNLIKLGRLGEQWLPVEVNYCTEFPAINYYRCKTLDLMRMVLGTKASAWAHEQEWRLVLVGRCGPIKLPPSIIDGVVFGMRLDRGIETEIRQRIALNERRIELLRVVHKPNSFELEVVPA